MRRILVTGSNKGIGLAIVTAILDEHDDTFVFLGSRDPGRGHAAREGLLVAHPAWSERLEALELDVASDASASAAARRVAARFAGDATPLYAVVNNAGIGLHGTDPREVLEVNTLGVRRVCEAFLPLLRPSDGRIVNITSASGPSFVHACSPPRQRFFLDPSLTWAQLQTLIDEYLSLDGAEACAAAGFGDGEPYGLSKACTNAYTVLLAREHPSLRINACTPGFIETDLTRPYAASVGKSPQDMGMKPPAAGARAPMFLLFGEPEGNGRYYGSDAQRSPLDRYRAPGSPPYAGDE
jgi:NAD(P)-dependent dehydrogenase (short-subunit alcohol dehydrogenase family)